MKIRSAFAPVTWKKVSVISTNNHLVLRASSAGLHFAYAAFVRNDEVRVESAATLAVAGNELSCKSFNINTIDRLHVQVTQSSGDHSFARQSFRRVVKSLFTPRSDSGIPVLSFQWRCLFFHTP